MKQDKRGSWYLLTGVVLGIAAGLLYSWVISPVKYVDAPPYALRADYKDEYRALVAAAYIYSGDLVRAEDRLAQLKDTEITKSLAKQAQQALAEGRPEEEVRALGILAMALGEQMAPITSDAEPAPTISTVSTEVEETQEPTMDQPINTITFSPSPNPSQNDSAPTLDSTIVYKPTSTAISTPTEGAPFELFETRLICNPDQPDPMIQVVIQDSAGQPVPGIEFFVSWSGGEDRFYTGMKPELGLGYADFVMNPEVVYTLSMSISGPVVNDLIAAECLADNGSHYWGSWLLTFVQP